MSVMYRVLTRALAADIPYIRYLQILYKLRDDGGWNYTKRLADELGNHHSSVAGNLRHLYGMGLVQRKKKEGGGKTIFYSISDAGLNLLAHLEADNDS